MDIMLNAMINNVTTENLWSVNLPQCASYMLSKCIDDKSQNGDKSQDDAILLFAYMFIANKTHYDPGYDLGHDFICDICKENPLCIRWTYDEYPGVISGCNLCTHCGNKIIARAASMQTSAIVMLSAIPFLANNDPEVNKDILSYIRGCVVALIKNEAQVFGKHCSHMQLLSYAHTYSLLLGSTGLTYSS